MEHNWPEAVKQNSYLDKNFSFYYWRTKQGSEIDLVLEGDGQLIGVEIKYSKSKINKAFVSRYPKANLKSITSKNFY